jgi:hypothetical protein
MRTTQKKKSIYGAFGIIAIALVAYVFFLTVLDVRHPREGEDPGSQESQNNAIIQSEEEKSLDSRLRGNDTTGELRGNDDAGVVSKNQTQAASSSNQVVLPKATISFVQGESFEIDIREEMTVYDAMKLLKEEGKITFEGKEYPTLGFFVTSINSISSGGGKNLFYYINGEEASVGISTYQIKEGDSIEWKLK